MKIVKNTLSDKLAQLFLAWVNEEEENREHDMENTEAWNALVQYLMDLEGKVNGTSS